MWCSVSRRYQRGRRPLRAIFTHKCLRLLPRHKYDCIVSDLCEFASDYREKIPARGSRLITGLLFGLDVNDIKWLLAGYLSIHFRWCHSRTASLQHFRPPFVSLIILNCIVTCSATVVRFVNLVFYTFPLFSWPITLLWAVEVFAREFKLLCIEYFVVFKVFLIFLHVADSIF